MFKSLLKFSVIATMAMFVFACKNTNNKPIIKFSRDSSSIIVKNIDAASLLKVKNAYANQNDANLVSVVMLPGELDSIQDQLLVAGKYQLQGDSLVFKPEKPFLKSKSYLVESFINVQFANADKLISGTIKQSLQPQKQILKR